MAGALAAAHMSIFGDTPSAIESSRSEVLQWCMYQIRQSNLQPQTTGNLPEHHWQGLLSCSVMYAVKGGICLLFLLSCSISPCFEFIITVRCFCCLLSGVLRSNFYLRWKPELRGLRPCSVCRRCFSDGPRQSLISTNNIALLLSNSTTLSHPCSPARLSPPPFLPSLHILPCLRHSITGDQAVYASHQPSCFF